jgi:hypothetical protein
MRWLPTRVHGYLDYIVGALMIAIPWLFDFARGGAETWIFVILGASAIAYSLFTNYELGINRTLSMRAHLMLDIGSGILLAASPWLFNFSEEVWAPHVFVGVFEILVASITKPEPSHGPKPTHRHRMSTGHF